MKSQNTQNKNSFIILATPAPISHRTAEENLGLGYLSAVLQSKGYNVKILDAWLNGWTTDELATKILGEKTPLFVGISAYQSNIDQAVKTLNAVKKVKDIKFVAGGFGPTFSPDLFLDSGFDYVIRGEGENAICELSDALRTNKSIKNIKGLGYIANDNHRYNEITKISYCLDELPFPTRDTMQLAIDRRTPVHLLTARGCTGHCTFAV
ncbi:MAG: cobalamin-dependent protein [Alphaproteobacteria bacterium]|nr:cobalamin-dependent protein [Alphaproteobacteria bacterium]